MKAEELRLGNWARIEYEPLCSGMDSQIISIKNTKEVVTKCEYGTQDDFVWDLEPIELTEEILLKAGFEKAKDGRMEFKKDGLRICLTVEGSWVAPDIMQDTDEWVSVEAVHILQNIYYFLKRKELTINL